LLNTAVQITDHYTIPELIKFGFDELSMRCNLLTVLHFSLFSISCGFCEKPCGGFALALSTIFTILLTIWFSCGKDVLLSMGLYHAPSCGYKTSAYATEW
jgi:hypothetical protein